MEKTIQNKKQLNRVRHPNGPSCVVARDQNFWKMLFGNNNCRYTSKEKEHRNLK